MSKFIITNRLWILNNNAGKFKENESRRRAKVHQEAAGEVLEAQEWAKTPRKRRGAALRPGVHECPTRVRLWLSTVVRATLDAPARETGAFDQARVQSRGFPRAERGIPGAGGRNGPRSAAAAFDGGGQRSGGARPTQGRGGSSRQAAAQAELGSVAFDQTGGRERQAGRSSQHARTEVAGEVPPPRVPQQRSAAREGAGGLGAGEEGAEDDDQESGETPEDSENLSEKDTVD